jgi:hypothetical protein
VEALIIYSSFAPFIYPFPFFVGHRKNWHVILQIYILLLDLTGAQAVKTHMRGWQGEQNGLFMSPAMLTWRNSKGVGNEKIICSFFSDFNVICFGFNGKCQNA